MWRPSYVDGRARLDRREPPVLPMKAQQLHLELRSHERSQRARVPRGLVAQCGDEAVGEAAAPAGVVVTALVLAVADGVLPLRQRVAQ
jgi:hypothetical protein